MLYTTKEVADILKLQHETVRKNCAKGKIKAVKVSNQWRISKEEVDTILGKR